MDPECVYRSAGACRAVMGERVVVVGGWGDRGMGGEKERWRK